MTHPWEPPCAIEDLPFADYLELDAASSHALAILLRKSPLHMKAGIDKQTRSKGLGSLVHAMLLSPDRIDDEIAIKPAGANKASNGGKALLVEWMIDLTGADQPEIDPKLAVGKQLDRAISILEPKVEKMDLIICSEEDKKIAEEMVWNIVRKDARGLFESGRSELTVMAIDPETGMLCKIRIDHEPDAEEWLMDLKTTTSAAFEDFSRIAARFDYPLQAAFYSHIYELATGECRPFVHVVAETEPPYDCAFYELDQPAMASGKAAFRRAMEIWSICEDIGYWPGIGYDWSHGDYRIHSLSIPKYALRGTIE